MELLAAPFAGLGGGSSGGALRRPGWWCFGRRPSPASEVVLLAAPFAPQLAELLPALNRAVESQAWADGGQVLARIRRLVGINLLLGLAAVVIASTRLSF